MSFDGELLQAIAVTAELCGTELSESAARVFCTDLSRYPKSQVLASLIRCRKELRGRLTLADVIARLDDGRPGPEEAWATCSRLTEADTIVWTQEMQAAHGTAQDLIDADEPVSARMAFLERYRALCQIARDSGVAVVWTASLGHNAKGREAPIMAAVESGRISVTTARGLLPWSVSPDVIERIEAKLGKLQIGGEHS